MTPFQHLLFLMDVKPQQNDHFIGDNHDIGLRQTFGGHLIGQAMMAAAKTVPADRLLHAVHCDFVLPGDSAHPIEYRVTRIRDGKSFSLRQVEAIQHNEPIFYLNTSFQLRESGFDFQTTMPQAPEWHNLTPDHITVQQYADVLPPKLMNIFTKESAFEVRSTTFSPPFICKNHAPTKSLWFKACGDVPADGNLNASLLAYFSDFHLIPTALQPQGLSFFEPNLQIASLNHAMWFHRPFSVGEWIFFTVDVTNTSGNRGLVKGQFFAQDGKLIASCVQEGVIRKNVD